MRKCESIRRGMAAALLVLGLACVGFIAYALFADAIWPEAPGDKVLSGASLSVDVSHLEKGYLMARGPKTDKRLKLRIEKGETKLNYDLNGNGEYEVFPLQLGSGSYTLTLFMNVSGKKYSQEGTVNLEAELEDESFAFLCPNQYVNYTPDSEAVRISEELCKGLTTDREKFEAIRAYMQSSFTYDYIKAATVQGGTLPDIDGTLEKGMGICQDLAAIAACMLRVQGVPTQLTIGYADRNYHAWNTVWIDGEEQRYDPTAELNAIPQNAVYTVERYY